jgi:hypothetical protein
VTAAGKESTMNNGTGEERLLSRLQLENKNLWSIIEGLAGERT